MRIGTKSVLFGAHCFLIHPIFLFIAWCRLYGFPFDPRLWIAFLVHDLGYIGKPNMDGKEGEKHVELGAKIMSVFGAKWRDLSLYHSRYYAKKNNKPVSKLCYADKLAFACTPRWIYLPMVKATGEIREYIQQAQKRNETGWMPVSEYYAWHRQLRKYMIRWVAVHRHGKEDTWTSKR
ncbi:MAG: HD domain-containing protein [Dysgonomonas sp.]